MSQSSFKKKVTALTQTLKKIGRFLERPRNDSERDKQERAKQISFVARTALEQ
jgi:hypothetical protein